MSLDQAPDINYNQTEAIAKAPVLKHSELPDYLQNQIDESLNRTCESKDQLKEEIKVENVYKALESKYGEAFDRCDFKVKDTQLGDKFHNYIGYSTYSLLNKEGKLVSYIKDNGETIIDMTTFEPFKDSLHESLDNHVGINYKQDSEGKWILIIDGEEYPEGSMKFNMNVIISEIK